MGAELDYLAGLGDGLAAPALGASFLDVVVTDERRNAGHCAARGPLWELWK
jgi:hypothetical protein